MTYIRICSNFNISTHLLYRVFKYVISVDFKGRLQKFSLIAYDLFCFSERPTLSPGA